MNHLIFLATRWVSQGTDSIYSKIGHNSAIKDVAQTLENGFANLLNNSTDFLGSSLRWVVVALALAIEGALSVEGMDLTEIIFGRLVDGVSVNKFAFELASGNTYGIVGATCYSALRAAVISFMVLIAAFLLCKGIWMGNGEKALAQFRGSLGTYLLSAGLLYVMPHIYEVLIYVRDLILYAVSTVSGVSETGSFVKGYRQLATSLRGMFDIGPSFLDGEFWTKPNFAVEGSFFAALMYLAMVCMVVYFAYTYVVNALSQMISFAMFPIVAMLAMKDSKVLSKWFSTVIALIAVPIVDSILFAIPIKFAGVMDESGAYKGSLMLFLVCMAIMPARKVVRGWIGGETFSSAAGIASLLMVGRMAAQAVGAAKNYRTGMADAGADKQRAMMYRELAGDSSVRISDGGMASFSGSKSSVNEFTSERAKKMSAFATVDNFEDREFANILSDDQRAHFYDQRAKRATARARGAAIGGVIGSVGGFGMTMFGGPAVQMVGVGAGGSLGSMIGAKIPKKGNVPYVEPLTQAPVAQAANPDSPERMTGDVLTREGMERELAGDREYGNASMPKRGQRAIGTGPVMLEANGSATGSALFGDKGVGAGSVPSTKEDHVAVIGKEQYEDAVSSVLSSETMQKHSSAGTMSDVATAEMAGEIVDAYAKACDGADFNKNSVDAMRTSITQALSKAFEGFSGDSEEFKALIADGGAVAGAVGLDFGNLGEGLSAEQFNVRLDALSDVVSERRAGKSVNVVEFSMQAAGNPKWNPNDLESQNEAIRQTGVSCIKECAMEVVNAASPNSVYSDREAEAVRMAEAFCEDFNADDLCKVLGVDADIVRAYRSV